MLSTISISLSCVIALNFKDEGISPTDSISSALSSSPSDSLSLSLKSFTIVSLFDSFFSVVGSQQDSLTIYKNTKKQFKITLLLSNITQLSVNL